MEKEIVNRVAQSPLVTIDLEEFYEPGERLLYDIKDLLYEGLILKEKDFRNHIKSHDWSMYANKHIAIFCSADAIIPTWAYMLLAAKLEPIASTLIFGNLNRLEETIFLRSLKTLNPKEFQGKKVVVKGCSKIEVPISIYVEVTRLLRPFASSIMYGEPCSTVPIYKEAIQRTKTSTINQ